MNKRERQEGGRNGRREKDDKMRDLKIGVESEMRTEDEERERIQNVQ